MITPPIVILVSNLSRIQGLAKGASDAVRLCGAETNWNGVSRTLLEIERLAGELLPQAPQAPGEASEPESSPRNINATQGVTQ